MPPAETVARRKATRPRGASGRALVAAISQIAAKVFDARPRTPDPANFIAEAIMSPQERIATATGQSKLIRMGAFAEELSVALISAHPRLSWPDRVLGRGVDPDEDTSRIKRRLAYQCGAHQLLVVSRLPQDQVAAAAARVCDRFAATPADERGGALMRRLLGEEWRVLGALPLSSLTAPHGRLVDIGYRSADGRGSPTLHLGELKMSGILDSKKVQAELYGLLQSVLMLAGSEEPMPVPFGACAFNAEGETISAVFTPDLTVKEREFWELLLPDDVPFPRFKELMASALVRVKYPTPGDLPSGVGRVLAKRQ